MDDENKAAAGVVMLDAPASSPRSYSCDKGRGHRDARLAVAKDRGFRVFVYCADCYGEWIESAFPVRELGK